MMERKEVPRLFFTDEEKKRIVQAVKEAEQQTAAEIVVRIEKSCPGDPITHCRELLTTLGLTSTQGRTGVLILISLSDHQVAVYGDVAIDRIIGPDGWRDICDHIIAGFRTDRPCEALCEAIGILAAKLSFPFPRLADDVDELSNEPSFPD